MVRVLVDRMCMLAKGFAFASSTFAIILLLNTTDANAQQQALPVDVAKPLVRTIVDWDNTRAGLKLFKRSKFVRAYPDTLMRFYFAMVSSSKRATC
ncbi:MAG: hypothetical protein AAFS08_06855 [Pseudomonadota bacterium]